jgi:hypothetical protein
MSLPHDEIVKLASGENSEVQIWGGALNVAGIKFRIVGDELTAGLGTTLPGSVEIWVHQNDIEAARHALQSDRDNSGRQKFGHPTSDPKPDHSRGPTHGAPPHRPLGGS